MTSNTCTWLCNFAVGVSFLIALTALREKVNLIPKNLPHKLSEAFFLHFNIVTRNISFIETSNLRTLCMMVNKMSVLLILASPNKLKLSQRQLLEHLTLWLQKLLKVITQISVIFGLSESFYTCQFQVSCHSMVIQNLKSMERSERDSTASQKLVQTAAENYQH